MKSARVEIVKRFGSIAECCDNREGCEGCPNEDVCYRIFKLKDSIRYVTNPIRNCSSADVEDVAYCIEELMDALGYTVVDMNGGDAE